ncbi:MAG: hypothetical protein JO262_17325 [Solirubrobacterales bacterium]|nr:hypothetical protein [Solirubrobacterales bacterium]MBV9943893.1 hypothetical protein [Solirubrobacterales bacterium]
MPDRMLPVLGAGGQPRHEALELERVETHAATTGHWARALVKNPAASVFSVWS